MLRDAGWLQVPLWSPPITWTAPSIATLPSWRDAKRVAIDVECRDDDLSALGPGVRRGAYMCGISFAIEDGPAAYLPFAHEGGGNLDPKSVLAYVRDQAAVFTGTIVGANLQYDCDYLWSSRIEFKQAVRHADVQLAEGLLDELQDSYSLDAILKRRGLPGKDETELDAQAAAWGLHAKKELWRLPAGAVGTYATQDVRGPLALLRRQEKDIEEQELGRAWDTECKVMLALLRMTRRGLRVDRDRLESISTWSQQIIADELAKIQHLTGVRCNSPMNARQLEPALKHQGLIPSRNSRVDKKTGNVVDSGPSIDAEFLEAHKGDPVIDAIKRARNFHKLDHTYCDGVRKHLVGDRLHPSYKQMRGGADDEDDDDEGARYGRTASRHPNAQAQPIRNKEYGKKWRAIYVPEPGERWVKCDYSQQEPRTTVHYAELCGLPGARDFAELYRNDPSTDSHSMFAAMSGLPRDQAKQVFLGLCYGMGGGKLATKLDLPTEMKSGKHGTYLGAGPAAQAVLDQFNARVPFVRKLAYLCSDKAKLRGFLLLIDGRRCRFPSDGHGNFDWTYKALNRLIQGSAAVQTKTALVILDENGFDPRLTVHDEFDFSMEIEQRARDAARLMMDALPLNVPSKVDADIGPDYGNLTTLTKVAA